MLWASGCRQSAPRRSYWRGSHLQASSFAKWNWKPLPSEREIIAGGDEIATLAGIYRVMVARSVPLAPTHLRGMNTNAAVAQVAHMHLAGRGPHAVIGTLAAQAPMSQDMQIAWRIGFVPRVVLVNSQVHPTKIHAQLALRANTKARLAGLNVWLALTAQARWGQDQLVATCACLASMRGPTMHGASLARLDSIHRRELQAAQLVMLDNTLEDKQHLAQHVRLVSIPWQQVQIVRVAMQVTILKLVFRLVLHALLGHSQPRKVPLHANNVLKARTRKILGRHTALQQEQATTMAPQARPHQVHVDLAHIKTTRGRLSAILAMMDISCPLQVSTNA